jgi:hypothetical protein
VIKDRVKSLLAAVPGMGPAYWRWLDRGGPTLHFTRHNSLDRLADELPHWKRAADGARAQASRGRNLVIFATFRYWIEHAALTGLALAGLGHDVRLITLPYARYKIPANRLDLQRQDSYLKSVLKLAHPTLRTESLLDGQPRSDDLPRALAAPIEDIALRDTQYSLRVEHVDRDDELFQLRHQRNRRAASLALHWLALNRPERIIIPNGSILEYGVIYHVARHLELPLVTYEFDEPQHRIRIAHDAEVMREETDEFWGVRRRLAFTAEDRERVRALLAARQGGSRWENFPIQFQGVPRQGEAEVRATLGLDERPIVLVAPNVFGDSATLGRQVFSRTMTEWLERTVRFFVDLDQVQLLIRIHPSEARFPYGSSMAEVVQTALPELPAHIHLIPADAPVNTYDLIDMADLGVVYTTTVGMEMAMSGVPVIVAGHTHYRGKGFTLDPDSWEDYFELLGEMRDGPRRPRLTQAQIQDVWHYAYRFFFEFTRPFPWHLLYFWDDVGEWPLERVLSPQGVETFGASFGALAGDPIAWEEIG